MVEKEQRRPREFGQLSREEEDERAGPSFDEPWVGGDDDGSSRLCRARQGLGCQGKVDQPSNI